MCRLTKTEHDILVDRANGLLSKEVADKRGLHIRTIESHLCNVRRKLKSKTTVQAVARALRDGVIKYSEILLVAWLCVGAIDTDQQRTNRAQPRPPVARVRRREDIV